MRLHRLLPPALQILGKNFYTNRAAAVRFRRADEALVANARATSARCLRDTATLEGWAAERETVRPQLAWMLGLSPLPARSDLRARVTGVAEIGSYRVEKLLFDSIPGLTVSANFYLPIEAAGPLPVVLYLNGHWPSLDGAKAGFQDRYLWYPENGFALLVVDPLQFGEVPGVHQGTKNLGRWDWLSLGYTPAGVEVWNAMRALDWLASRPEVDSSRVGVTGISGGGITTQYLAALDERVKVAAPSCSTYTIGDQVANRRVPQQCDCTFFPNVYGLDFPHVLALIAPRPLLVMGGRKDPIFPPSGYRAAVELARRVYALHPEGEERVRLVESNDAHADPPVFLGEVRAWMCRWLGGNATRASIGDATSAFKAAAGRELRSLAEVPDAALNYSIDAHWIASSEPTSPRSIEKWEVRRRGLIDVIRRRVFGWFPADDVPFGTRRLVGSGGYAGEIARYAEYEIDSEQGVPVAVQVMVPHDNSGPTPLLIWIRRPEDHAGFPDLDEMLPLVSTTAIVMLTPRFADAVLQPAERARIERNAAITGRTIAAMHVWDALRAIAWGQTELGLSPSRVEVYGRGDAGLAAGYAALLNESVDHCVLASPPASHRDGAALLTVLRDTDVSEMLAAVAPRQVTIVGPHALNEVVQSVHAVLGADSFSVASSVADAVLAARSRGRSADGMSRVGGGDAH